MELDVLIFSPNIYHDINETITKAHAIAFSFLLFCSDRKIPNPLQMDLRHLLFEIDGDRTPP